MLLSALRHPIHWFRSYRHSLARPMKRALVCVGLGLLGLTLHAIYIQREISSTVDPVFEQLHKISKSSSSKSRWSPTDVRWSGDFRLPGEQVNEEAYRIIRSTLKSGDWQIVEEATVLLPGNHIGGFMLRAEHHDYTFIAHLAKPKAELRLVVGKSESADVSRATADLQISGH